MAPSHDIKNPISKIETSNIKHSDKNSKIYKLASNTFLMMRDEFL
jgi:hypothetical protein